MKTKKRFLLAALVFGLVVCSGSAAIIYLLYSNINPVLQERVETTEIDISRAVINRGETKLKINKNLAATAEGSLTSTIISEVGKEDLIKYDYFKTPVNDFVKVNYHSNSYSEIYYDKWIADANEVAKEVLFISGYYDGSFPNLYSAVDLAKYLGVPKPSLTEPQKRLVYNLSEEQLLSLWQDKENLVSLSAGELVLEYNLYSLSKATLKDLQVNFEDGSSMMMTITTNVGALGASDSDKIKGAAEQTKAAVGLETFTSNNVLGQDIMSNRLLVGDKNLRKTLTVFIGSGCYEGDAQCDNFFNDTLPYMLTTAEGKGFSVRIQPFILNSGLDTAVSSNALLCAAEQEKLKPLLLDFRDWQRYVEYDNNQKLVPFSMEAGEKFTEMGLNQAEFRKCVNSSKYFSMVSSRFAASLSTGQDTMAIVRLNNNPSSDVVYPNRNTIDQLYRR